MWKVPYSDPQVRSALNCYVLNEITRNRTYNLWYLTRSRSHFRVVPISIPSNNRCQMRVCTLSRIQRRITDAYAKFSWSYLASALRALSAWTASPRYLYLCENLHLWEPVDHVIRGKVCLGYSFGTFEGGNDEFKIAITTITNSWIVASVCLAF